MLKMTTREVDEILRAMTALVSLCWEPIRYRFDRIRAKPERRVMATLKSPYSQCMIAIDRGRTGILARYNQSATLLQIRCRLQQIVIIGSIFRCGGESADGRGYRLAPAPLITVDPITGGARLFPAGENGRPRSGNSAVNSPISGRKAQT